MLHKMFHGAEKLPRIMRTGEAAKVRETVTVTHRDPAREILPGMSLQSAVPILTEPIHLVEMPVVLRMKEGPGRTMPEPMIREGRNQPEIIIPIRVL